MSRSSWIFFSLDRSRLSIPVPYFTEQRVHGIGDRKSQDHYCQNNEHLIYVWYTIYAISQVILCCYAVFKSTFVKSNVNKTCIRRSIRFVNKNVHFKLQESNKRQVHLQLSLHSDLEARKNMTTTSTYPFKWVPSPPELEATKKRLFEADSNQIDGVVASPWNFFMPKTMLEDFDKIYSFEVRPDDVWILTYPKCGTTWTQVSPYLSPGLEDNVGSFWLGNGVADHEQRGLEDSFGKAAFLSQPLSRDPNLGTRQGQVHHDVPAVDGLQKSWSWAGGGHDGDEGEPVQLHREDGQVADDLAQGDQDSPAPGDVATESVGHGQGDLCREESERLLRVLLPSHHQQLSPLQVQGGLRRLRWHVHPWRTRIWQLLGHSQGIHSLLRYIFVYFMSF